MTPQDNMLEVFRQAGTSSSEPSGGAGGPFGGGSGGGAPGPPAGGGARGLVFVGSVLIAFVLGVAVGRQLFGSGETRAAEPEQSGRDWIEQERSESSGVPAQSEVGALYDPSLRWTVVVVTYGNTTTQQEYAWNTYDHLVASGFEAYPPLSRGDKIVVLAGAAPESEQLTGLQVRIRALDGWDGKSGAFKTAYVEQIDNLIDR